MYQAYATIALSLALLRTLGVGIKIMNQVKIICLIGVEGEGVSS